MENNNTNNNEITGVVIVGPVKEITQSSVTIATRPGFSAKFKINEYTKLVNAESLNEIKQKQIIAIRHILKVKETDEDKNNREAYLINAKPNNKSKDAIFIDIEF